MTNPTVSHRTKTLKICSVEACSSRHYGRGLCNLHYKRVYESGSGRTDLKTPEERFWEKVKKDAPNGCWEWQGALLRDGRGQVNFKRRIYRAHRLAWLLVHGVEASEHLLHSCDNSRCCNPSHLREGSHQENMQDMMSRSRQAKGSRLPHSKLTEADIPIIRSMIAQGLTQSYIASAFQVSQPTIARLASGANWRHV